MHSLALHFIPVLGAEKSKVPFYIAGGLLVLWAIVIGLGVGIRRPDDFPANLAGQRLIVAVSAVLVIATAAMAVVTSGGKSAKAQAATSTTGASSGASSTTESAPATSTTASSSTTSSNSSSPTATTGTPAPPSSPAAPAGPLKLAANPEGQLTYDTKQLSAKAGDVTIEMANMSPVPHNVTIAQGSTVLGATPTFQGGTKTLKVTLKPGTYTFYCSVPGHRQAGMEGTLTVS